MTDLTLLPATQLVQLLSTGGCSASELLEQYIDKIESLDAVTNAVVQRNFEAARLRAREFDQNTHNRTNCVLQGLPITMKESFNISGLRTTWGMSQWKDYTPHSDALVTQALKSAGANILGKTNAPAMLGDYQTYNDVYGQTNNPWNPALTPGGSSGGSAVAIACGYSALEFGSDLGGSLRNPAHYCGVFSHKPTWGIVPMHGHQPPYTEPERNIDLAVAGPLARSAADLQLALNIIARPTPDMVPGWHLKLPEISVTSFRDLRVAFWHSSHMAPVSEDISAKSAELASVMSRLGATVSDSAFPDFDLEHHRITYLRAVAALTATGTDQQGY
ncbi:MAG: amidase, partial [Pseudomonadales bacterium]|nr:amidase [Pseudomonadales bacterium]